MAEEVYEVYLTEIREYLKSSKDDDENILNLLKRGHHVVMSHCGVFSLGNMEGRNLVFDWVRFAFNGYSEHFFDSYLNELNGFRMQVWMDGESNAEEA